MRNTRVAGHGLANEGAAFDEDGKRINGGTGGVGRAHCSCTEKSEILPSSGARKAWHEAHKDEAKAAKQATA